VLGRVSSVAVIAFALLAAPAAAAPAAPGFGPAVKLAGAGGGTEPRVAIAPNGTRYVITNDAATNEAVVYASPDGASWRRTAQIPGQSSASIDTDVAIASSGRIVAVELDGAGLNFVVAFSDDGGATWQQSTGATTADQDRPWLAAGPDNRMYLLFHNLASGAAQHEMFVSTSTDGGATFGPPVPIAMPGEQAYLDLQCADSGAPSALVVNQRSGRLYAVYGTRTSPAGGCGASATGTPEANVVGETRIWVGTSPDGSVGSWQNHLAADAGDKTVSASFEPAALDRAGELYVAYVETAHTYPDFSGGSVKYVHAGPAADKWSQPQVVAAAGPVGHYDPSIVAGDPGELALAYYEGVPRAGADPVWFVRAARVSAATSASPPIADSQVSGIPAYAQSPNAMGGSCASGPLAGLQNGVVCNRASDDWGLALDPACRLTVAFPTVQNDAPGSDVGTFVSTQTDGSRPCGQPPASAGATPGAESGPPALRRRIKIEHLGGRAAALERRWRARGYASLRAKTSRGIATGARAYLYRRGAAGRLVLVARSRGPARLTTSPHTFRMPLVRAARIVSGRYLSVVRATIAGERVTRARPLRLR
jgi:hypothetical protein